MCICVERGKQKEISFDLNMGDHFGYGTENGLQVLRTEWRRVVKCNRSGSGSGLDQDASGGDGRNGWIQDVLEVRKICLADGLDVEGEGEF